MNILNATDLHTRAKYGIAFSINEIMTQTAAALAHNGTVNLITAGDPELAIPVGTRHYAAKPTHRWSGKWRYTPDHQRMCEGIIRSQNITVVHIHGVWTHPTFAANRAARRCGVPTVLTNQGQLTPWALSQPGVLGPLKKQAYLRTYSVLLPQSRC